MTESDLKKLEELNQAVKLALKTRRDWLDSKMTMYARVPIGDYIYDLSTGKKLGKVSRLYRYWQDRDEGVRDTSLSIDYEYEFSPNCFDNTSRQTCLIFGKKEEVWR